MQDLAWVDRAGRVDRLKLPAGSYTHARLSPNGDRVVFGADDGKEANIYLYALGGGTSMQRLTFGGNSRFPIWSADGKRIAFQSDREGDRGIFWQRADGAGVAERLTKADDGTAHVPESWAPGGERFLYTVTKDSTVTLWVFSVHEKKGSRFDEVESLNPTGAVFSPDGRWVAYSTARSFPDATDRTIYVEPFPPTGAKYQIPGTTSDRAHHPIWSRNGKELFHEPGPSQLIMIPVQTEPALAFGSPVSLPDAGRFGGVSPLFLRDRDLTPDGQRFIAPVFIDQDGRETGPSEIRVVLNWFEELKARVPTN
jgi:Tol biopolymer transport system component